MSEKTGGFVEGNLQIALPIKINMERKGAGTPNQLSCQGRQELKDFGGKGAQGDATGKQQVGKKLRTRPSGSALLSAHKRAIGTLGQRRLC